VDVVEIERAVWEARLTGLTEREVVAAHTGSGNDEGTAAVEVTSGRFAATSRSS
jgi:hypothetical protein